MSEKQKKSKAQVVPAPFAKKAPRPGEAGAGDKQSKATPQAAGRRKRGRLLVWGSLLLTVFLPSVLVALYYAFVAADQYAVETRFAVRSASAQLNGGLLNSLGLSVGGSNDSYIVMEYIHSREILKRIDKKLNLKEKYHVPTFDLWARLPDDISYEDFLDYWKSMVHVGIDRTSHIITVKVYAFTAQDARDIARAILTESERMVNELSERARIDALAYARQEVSKAEERLRRIRHEFLKFRSNTQQIDPTKQAQVQVTIIGKLETQLSELQAKLAEARSYLSERAPTVVFLKNRITALKSQIRKEKLKLGKKKSAVSARDGASRTFSKVLTEYEALLVEREFAEKLYISALSGLEQARILANEQQRYLATFVKPYVPDEALYPRRVRNTIFVFLSLLLAWALGTLMVQSVRDRM